MKISMDFDGTIALPTTEITKENYNDRYIGLIPNYPVIEKMRELNSIGVEFVIFTARGMYTYDGNKEKCEDVYRSSMEDWLNKYQVPYSDLIFGKVGADFYVDDKNMSISEFCDFSKEI